MASKYGYYVNYVDCIITSEATSELLISIELSRLNIIVTYGMIEYELSVILSQIASFYTQIYAITLNMKKIRGVFPSFPNSGQEFKV